MCKIRTRLNQNRYCSEKNIMDSVSLISRKLWTFEDTSRNRNVSIHSSRIHLTLLKRYFQFWFKLQCVWYVKQNQSTGRLFRLSFEIVCWKTFSSYYGDVLEYLWLKKRWISILVLFSYFLCSVCSTSIHISGGLWPVYLRAQLFANVESGLLKNL